MLTKFRAWLESELQLLSSASHHAYSFGQANMAKRALERLDQEGPHAITLSFERETIVAALTAFAMLEEQGTLAPALATLRDALRAALDESSG